MIAVFRDFIMYLRLAVVESALCNRRQSSTSVQLKQSGDRIFVFIRLKIRMIYSELATITCGHSFDIFSDAIFHQPWPALVWHCDASSCHCLYHSDVYNFAV